MAHSLSLRPGQLIHRMDGDEFSQLGLPGVTYLVTGADFSIRPDRSKDNDYNRKESVGFEVAVPIQDDSPAADLFLRSLEDAFANET